MQQTLIDSWKTVDGPCSVYRKGDKLIMERLGHETIVIQKVNPETGRISYKSGKGDEFDSEQDAIYIEWRARHGKRAPILRSEHKMPKVILTLRTWK